MGAGFCTPTGGNPDYGGAHVFALDKHGPWMTQSPAEAALKAKVTGAAEHPGPGGILVERIGEGRVGYLDALFAELAANGWEPNEVSEDGQRSPGNR